MLVYYFVYAAGTVEKVAQGLTDSPGELTVWARLAYEGGEELRTRIKPGAWMPAKEVQIVVGTPASRPGAVFVPISWKATGADVLFPVLEADLIVEAVGDHMTQITLRGSYKPPLGPVGRLLDRALLHHLAEGCVKTSSPPLGGHSSTTGETPVPGTRPPGGRSSTSSDKELRSMPSTHGTSRPSPHVEPAAHATGTVVLRTGLRRNWHRAGSSFGRFTRQIDRLHGPMVAPVEEPLGVSGPAR